MNFFMLSRNIIAVIILILFQLTTVYAEPIMREEHTALIDIVNNSIIIQAMINGKGPYRFFLDTGSSGSYVSSKVAKQLKLPFESARHIMLNEMPHEFNYYRIQNLSIGNAVISNFEVGVTPLLDTVNQKFAPKDRVDGVLGFDAFKDFLLTLNVKAGTLSLKSGNLNPKDINTFPFEPQIPALCIIPISVQDDKGAKLQFKVMVDTGEGSEAPSIMLPISMHKLPFTVISRSRISYLQMTRNDEMYQSQVNATAFIGNNRAFKNPILIHHTKPFAGTETYHYGLIGMGMIKSLIITFDQKSSLVKIE